MGKLTGKLTGVLLGDGEFTQEVLLHEFFEVTESWKGEELTKRFKGNGGYLTLRCITEKHSGNISRGCSFSDSLFL